jgi:hypothetical protein
VLCADCSKVEQAKRDAQPKRPSPETVLLRKVGLIGPQDEI